jgi:hypothetical protein
MRAMDEYPRVTKDEKGRMVLELKPPDTRVEDTIRNIGAFFDDLARAPIEMMDEMRAADEARIRRRAQREAEGIARQEAMLRELAVARQTAQRAEAREAAADERARRAEESERATAERSEKRDRFRLRLTVASTAFGLVGAAAAVVAIVG